MNNLYRVSPEEGTHARSLRDSPVSPSPSSAASIPPASRLLKIEIRG